MKQNGGLCGRTFSFIDRRFLVTINIHNMTLGSDSSTVTSDLIGLTRWLTETNATKFSAANIKALLNQGMHKFINELIRAGSDIDFNMVTESINLVDGTAVYDVTGKVLRIKRANITYDGTKPHEEVTFFDISERGEPLDSTSISNDFSESDPYADLYWSDETLKVKLYPVPDENVTDGLTIWKTLEPTDLSDSSDEPSIPEAYQTYLAQHAAKAYFAKKGLRNKAREMDAMMVEIEEKAKRHYQSVDQRVPYVMRPTKGFSDYK